MATGTALMPSDDRAEPHDETMHRVPLRGDAGRHMATIVNVSPNGFMARCDGELTIGDRVEVTLPVVGTFDAEVRWALGGRIGCRLAQEVPPALYQFVVAAMRHD